MTSSCPRRVEAYTFDDISAASPTASDAAYIKSPLDLDQFKIADSVDDYLLVSNYTSEILENEYENYYEAKNELSGVTSIADSNLGKTKDTDTPEAISVQANRTQFNPVVGWDGIEKDSMVERKQPNTYGHLEENNCLHVIWDGHMAPLDFMDHTFVPTPYMADSERDSEYFLTTYCEQREDQSSHLSDSWCTAERSPYGICGSSKDGSEEYERDPVNEFSMYEGPGSPETSTLSDDTYGTCHNPTSQYEKHSATEAVAQTLPAVCPLKQPSVQGSDHERLAASMQHANNDHGNINRKWWACPWYKQNPRKYQICAKYKLHRIKDVKQHAYRKHMKPEIYCPLCFETFTRPDERDGHVQKKNCGQQAEPKFEGISEQQRKLLNQSANRGKNDEEQWFIMWHTIFPTESRPKSPYIGNSYEELLPLLRNFWDKRSPEIISGAFDVSQPGVETQTIRTIVDSIFDRFEKESSSWGVCL
ncbi:uncharacterized protein F4822DRAFT_395323 [Hypoxylon trugodes]|uniref:uncharacterized protein n=1 Tax=Hypoxylon trugodes TaxID=326681 RepID=UPI0021914614|nr:uncharacterized protein F4822DRAFT_395323 [Hypoxylon trugodes]KAI1391061.1 hypothetical protein F4822DRAFT_395323 [Hypoxylon trugodes]